MTIACYLAFDRDSYYLADENLFKEINNEFEKRGKIFIYGPPGIGKSSFANEFGHRLKEQKIIVLWLDVDKEDKVKKALKYLLCAFKVKVDDNDSDKAKIQSLNDAIREMFDSKFLFILDNVEQYKHVDELIKNLPSNVKCLITTRCENLNSCLRKFEINLFDSNRAKSYIKKRNESMGRNIDDQEINTIVQYLSEGTNSLLALDLQLFIELLQERKLSQVEVILRRCNKELKFMEIVFDELKERNTDAYEMLVHMAYLDPDFIHPETLSMLMNKEPNEIEEYQEALSKLSLTKIVQKDVKEFENSWKLDKNETANIMCLRIHRLIQEKVRIFILYKYPQWEKKVTELFAKLEEHIFDWHSFKLQKLEENEKKKYVFIEARKHIKKLCEIIMNKHEKEKKEENILRKDNFEALLFKGKVSCFLNKISDAKKQFNNYWEFLCNEKSEEVQCEEKKKKTLNEIGNCFYNNEEYSEAIEWLEKIKIEAKDEQSDKAQLMVKIAVCYSNTLETSKDRDKVIEFYENAIKILIQYQGEYNEEVTFLELNLANYLDSLKFQKKNESDYSRVQFLKDAIYWYKQVLKIKTNLYAANTKDVVKLKSKIAKNYYLIKEYNEAIRFYKEAIEVQAELNGEECIEVKELNKEIAYCYQLSHNYEDAIKYYEKELKLHRNNDQSNSRIHRDIGYCYLKTNKYDQAIKHYQQSLETMIHLNSEIVTDCINHITHTLNYLDRHEDAQEWYDHLFKLVTQFRDKQSEEVATLKTKLARYYKEKGNYNKATEFYENAIAIFSQLKESKAKK